jgi:hypothetical protein
MNAKQLTGSLAAFAVAFTLIVSASAFAEEIYKWTDKDGNVHYGDRPTGQETEERLKVSYNRTNPEAVQGELDAVREAEESRLEARAQAAEDKLSAEEERIAAEQKKVDCEADRAIRDKMLVARRVYREDDAGERVYLDEVQREASIAVAEKNMKDSCDS